MFTEKWSMNNLDRHINDCIPPTRCRGVAVVTATRCRGWSQAVTAAQVQCCCSAGGGLTAALPALAASRASAEQRKTETEENSEQCFSRHVRTVLLYVHMHVMATTHAVRLIIKAVFIDRL